MSEVEPTEPAIARWPVFLAGAGLGLLAAYVLDPQNGQDRRTQIRDQSVTLKNKVATAGGRRTRAFTQRLRGWFFELTARYQSIPLVDDATLVQRVRSEFGHSVRFAQAVRVDAFRGVVTLSGPVLHENIGKLMTCVKNVPGVRGVVDELDRHERRAHVAH